MTTIPAMRWYLSAMKNDERTFCGSIELDGRLRAR